MKPRAVLRLYLPCRAHAVKRAEAERHKAAGSWGMAGLSIPESELGVGYGRSPSKPLMYMCLGFVLWEDKKKKTKGFFFLIS